MKICAAFLGLFLAAQVSAQACDQVTYNGCLQAVQQFGNAQCARLTGSTDSFNQCQCYRHVSELNCHQLCSTVAARSAEAISQTSADQFCATAQLDQNNLPPPSEAPWLTDPSVTIAPPPIATPTSSAASSFVRLMPALALALFCISLPLS